MGENGGQRKSNGGCKKNELWVRKLKKGDRKGIWKKR